MFVSSYILTLQSLHVLVSLLLLLGTLAVVLEFSGALEVVLKV
jgi:hypothetical protein